MLFRLGPPELVITLFFLLIIFGVGQLPQTCGSMGKVIREFRNVHVD